MWKPAERIKYKPVAGKWPSAEEAADSLLFTPFQHGRLSLSQRTWIPAMVPWRATEEGEVTKDVLEWYQRFAQGKPGAIVVEATGIRDVPSGPLLRIGHDRYLPGLKKIVKTVREASDGETKLFIQIIDFLSIKRRPDKDKFLTRFLKITEELKEALAEPDWDDDQIRAHLCMLDDEALAEILDEREYESLTRGFRERVTDTEYAHINELPQTLPDLFSAAAVRAEQAGFDGVELHYAHAYTMASFLSRLNIRTDGYGGSSENRVRLPLEVFQQVRHSVSKNFLVGCRMLTEDCIEGGTELDDSSYFATEFAKAGMDFISLSRGGKFEDAKIPKVGQAIYPYTGKSGYECMPGHFSDKFGPFGRNIVPGEKIFKAVRAEGLTTPIVTAGGIHSFEQAENILQNKQADIIGLARQAMADPDWFRKIKGGYGEQVNLCEYTNYCEGLDSKHKVVTCQLWDRTDLDKEGVSKTADGKRRTTAPSWKK